MGKKKKIISIFGMLFAISCIILGIVFVSGKMSKDIKSPKLEMQASDVGQSLAGYKFGADFYTEVYKGIQTINENIIIQDIHNATNLLSLQADIVMIDKNIKQTSNNINIGIGSFFIIIGVFMFLFYLEKFVCIENKTENNNCINTNSDVNCSLMNEPENEQNNNENVIDDENIVIEELMNNEMENNEREI